MEVQYPPGTQVYDTPDPPPVETWLDVYSGQFNRWAETLARVARLFGFLP
jgi:hypothetical protein